MDSGEEEGGEEELEDKVDELESELEDLRAEFEKLLADEEGLKVTMLKKWKMDMDRWRMATRKESVEYDLDETTDEDERSCEEATKLSDNVAEPKGGDADNMNHHSQSTKKTNVTEQVHPVKANRRWRRQQRRISKRYTPTDNIKVEPKKA